jgi:signal transduction histidine kinase
VASNVFEPFFTTASTTGGTGLGLFIVYNLVTDGLGGTIRLQTSPGEGCAFEIHFTDSKESGGLHDHPDSFMSLMTAENARAPG